MAHYNYTKRHHEHLVLMFMVYILYPLFVLKTSLTMQSINETVPKNPAFSISTNIPSLSTNTKLAFALAWRLRKIARLYTHVCVCVCIDSLYPS